MGERLTKSEIVERIRSGKAEIDRLATAVRPAELGQPGVNGEWSVKDLLAHLTFWHLNALENVRNGLQGTTPSIPDAPPESWKSWTDETNLRVYLENKDRPLEEVRADFDRTAGELIALLESLPESDYAAGSQLEATLTNSVEETVGPDTWEHYPEHIRQLREWKG